MNTPPENEQSNTTYRKMKQSIDASHPRGWFVAIANDQILAASADFHELEGMLRAQGKDPRNVLVVQAGVDHPEYVNIFV